jgi:hypothetical protein
LVCSFDGRDPVQQRRADEILRDGLVDDSLVLARTSRTADTTARYER